MSQWDEINRRAIVHIAMDIRDGVADPDDARRLLEHFCDCVDNNAPIPHELARHLSDSFKAYLKEGKTLESSFGVARKEGRPQGKEEAHRIEMATEFLRLRLQGVKHKDALADISFRFHRSISVVGEAWSWYAEHALLQWQADNAEREPLTKEQEQRLRRIMERHDRTVENRRIKKKQTENSVR